MPIAVKVDEDLPAEIADLVRTADHDAKIVCDQGHTGLSDDQLWPKVQQEARMLVTADKSFANARSYPPGSHAGVVLFRLPRESRAGYIRLANFLLAQLTLDDVAGAIVVVSAILAQRDSDAIRSWCDLLIPRSGSSDAPLAEISVLVRFRRIRHAQVVAPPAKHLCPIVSSRPP
jgi:predicted nuclease of predicted toxin-antitoxin system